MRKPIIPMLCLIQLLPARLHAQDTERDPLILIVGMKRCCPTDHWPEAERKTRAEFIALNLRTKVVMGSASRGREQLIELAELGKQNGAVYAVRLIRPSIHRPGGVDLWRVERATGETVLRYIPTREGTGPEAASIAALRAVEAYQASLIDLMKATEPAEVKMEPPPPPEAKAQVDDIHPGPARPFIIRLGAGALFSPGGTGARGIVDLCVGWKALPPFSFEIHGAFSVLDPDVSHEGSKASLDFAQASAWAYWHVSDKGWFLLSLGLGVGAVFLSVQGTGEGSSSETDRRAAAVVGAEARTALVLTGNLRLYLALRAGVALPGIEVIHGVNSAAIFGLPVLEGSLGLEILIH